MLLFWIKCYRGPISNIWPIGYGPIRSGQLKLWATWKSGPFWPLLRKSVSATGQAALLIPIPLEGFAYKSKFTD